MMREDILVKNKGDKNVLSFLGSKNQSAESCVQNSLFYMNIKM